MKIVSVAFVFFVGMMMGGGCSSAVSVQDAKTDSGTIRFTEQTIDSAIQIGYGLALGDVDGDGRTDILLADKKQIVWYRNGDWKKFVMAENLTAADNVCLA